MPYRYGTNDCACFARAAIEAVTGVDIAPGVAMPKGWLAAARVMMSRGWETVDDMATELLGTSIDPKSSRPGDIVSYEAGGEFHLAVRIGDAAVTPTMNGTQIVEPHGWVRAWKVG